MRGREPVPSQPRPPAMSLPFYRLPAGAGGDEQIHQPGKPGRFPAPHRGAAGHRHVLHRLVLRVSPGWGSGDRGAGWGVPSPCSASVIALTPGLQLRGDFYQVHAGHLQGAVDLAGGFALHGLRRPLPAAVGRYLRLRPGRRSTGTTLSIPMAVSSPRSQLCLCLGSGGVLEM